MFQTLYLVISWHGICDIMDMEVPSLTWYQHLVPDMVPLPWSQYPINGVSRAYIYPTSGHEVSRCAHTPFWTPFWTPKGYG